MTVTCWAWGQPVPCSSRVTSRESCPGPAGSRPAVPARELPMHLLCASLVYGSLLENLSPPGLCVHRTGSRSADSNQADFTDCLAHFHILWHSNPSMWEAVALVSLICCVIASGGGIVVEEGLGRIPKEE